MTNRTITLTVALEHEMRTDDVQVITDAIEMIKGVLSVTPIVFDHAAHMNAYSSRKQLRAEFYEKIEELFKDK